MKITAKDLKKFEVIDKVIKEPHGGARKNPSKMAINLKEELIKSLKDVQEMSVDEIVQNRYDKFRKFGANI